MNSTSNEILPQDYRMTELGPLPKEWEIINLDEIIDLKRGISWRKEEANKEGNGIPVIGIPNIKENGIIDFIDTYFLTKDIPVDKMLRINDILFVGSSGSIKNIGRNVLIREIQKNKFTYASFTFLGRVDPLKANTEYIFYLLNSPMVDYNKYARRASDGKYNFQLTQFKNEQKLPLPPLPEQQRIADVLSAVQEAKEKTEAVIDATKALKKSMMKHLFTYGPVSPEEAENVPLKETEIGKVPEEWKVVKLGEVTEKAKQKDPRRDSSNEFKYVDVSAISNDALKITSYSEFLGKDAPHRARKAIQTDDIIFATVRPYLKRIAIVPENLNGQIVSTAFCVIRCKKQIANPYYIFYTVSLDNFVNSVTENQRGSSYPAVTDKDILNQYVPLPPLPVQQKIASILSAIDAKIEAEENKKQALEELFKTLLDNLMTAKIRVNHLEVPS
ncbi:MAG: Type-1 restriction enzyme EcoKI specificity protein [Firmicutes bacterium ADurb.Bin080]|nr:MAG: Type-1 restriction enzyme EcoKI specificity protein [Firmicutes bacterium ADurb.Bin080]